MKSLQISAFLELGYLHVFKIVTGLTSTTHVQNAFLRLQRQKKNTHALNLFCFPFHFTFYKILSRITMKDKNISFATINTIITPTFPPSAQLPPPTFYIILIPQMRICRMGAHTDTHTRSQNLHGSLLSSHQ